MKAVVFHDIGFPIGKATEVYEAFDRRNPGWLKVELLPAQATE